MTYDPGWNFGRGRGYDPGIPHYGNDYPAPWGTPIPAADSGTVVFSGMVGSGSCLYISEIRGLI